MNLQQLKDRISYAWSGYGHYKVFLTFRGKEYSAITTNMQAIDAANTDCPPIRKGEYYETQKEALKALYDEVKRKNNLK